MSTEFQPKPGEFGPSFALMRPLRAVETDGREHEMLKDAVFIKALESYAAVADRPNVAKLDRDSARATYQAALVDVLSDRLGERTQDGDMSDAGWINGALHVATHQQVRARMEAWDAQSGSGWRRGFMRRRAPDWGAEAALPRGVYQIHNGRKDVTREGIDRVTRALLGMPPPESHKLRLVVQPGAKPEPQRPEKRSWLRRKTAVLAAAGALAVAGVGTVLAGGELPGDRSNERAASGDTAAEIATTNAANRSFKQIGNVSILGAAKKQQMQVELKQIADEGEKESKTSAPEWKSIPGAPKEFWGQENKTGYRVFANPNDPNSNSIWVISEQIANEYAGEEVSDKKVGKLANAITKLRRGKSELLQPKEKLSFSKQLLQRIIGS